MLAVPPCLPPDGGHFPQRVAITAQAGGIYCLEGFEPQLRGEFRLEDRGIFQRCIPSLGTVTLQVTRPFHCLVGTVYW